MAIKLLAVTAVALVALGTLQILGEFGSIGFVSSIAVGSVLGLAAVLALIKVAIRACKHSAATPEHMERKEKVAEEPKASTSSTSVALTGEKIRIPVSEPKRNENLKLGRGAYCFTESEVDTSDPIPVQKLLSIIDRYPQFRLENKQASDNWVATGEWWQVFESPQPAYGTLLVELALTKGFPRYPVSKPACKPISYKLAALISLLDDEKVDAATKDEFALLLADAFTTACQDIQVALINDLYARHMSGGDMGAAMRHAWNSYKMERLTSLIKMYHGWALARLDARDPTTQIDHIKNRYVAEYGEKFGIGNHVIAKSDKKAAKVPLIIQNFHKQFTRSLHLLEFAMQIATDINRSKVEGNIPKQAVLEKSRHGGAGFGVYSSDKDYSDLGIQDEEDGTFYIELSFGQSENELTEPFISLDEVLQLMRNEHIIE